jgi:hypothetical protein
MAPHLHAAVRGAIPRATIRQVVRATYVQVWWPRFDRPVYVNRTPVWDGAGYCDTDTGQVLPTFDQALDDLELTPENQPAHVQRFGSQVDMAGIIAPSRDADRAIRYLTKYLAKSIAATYADQDDEDPEVEAHIDRMHRELIWLPCSEHCANWLRYGIQPKNAGPGLQPGMCPSHAHDRENLGIGGRRVLVSRQWSGKTLKEHRADRATVVRETLLNAGIVAPEIERMAADITLPDGRPRFLWSEVAPDPWTYAMVIMRSVVERSRWREQYEAAKRLDTHSAIRSEGRPDEGPAP